MGLAMSTFKTLLIDDNEAFLALAMHLLKPNPRIEIVGRGDTGFDAVRLADSLKPDLILMDLSMPGMCGLQATRLIKAQDAPPIIFIASQHNDAEHREHSARAGADGFVSKQDFDTGVDALLDRVGTEMSDG